MIRATDRVAAVLARDARLIDEFTALSPAFERLRSPSMRKTMSRLVTVEQAAKMAGLDAAVLVERLNRALAGAPGPGGGVDGERPDAHGPVDDAPAMHDGATAAPVPNEPAGTGDVHGPDHGGQRMTDRVAGTDESTADVPPALAAVPAERIVDVDVREALKRGEEPFSTIMAARRSLPPGGVLRVRAIFEPVPLYAVMGKQGLDHWTERFAEDDWRVWFYPDAQGAGAGEATGPEGSGGVTPAAAIDAGGVTAGAAPTASVAPDPAADRAAARGAPEDGAATVADGDVPSAGDPAEDDVVILDVRGLEPPEPMVLTLEALETLPAGKTLVQLNVRVPQFLLPQLEARGFVYEIREQSRDLVRVFIRRSDGH